MTVAMTVVAAKKVAPANEANPKHPPHDPRNEHAMNTANIHPHIPRAIAAALVSVAVLVATNVAVASAPIVPTPTTLSDAPAAMQMSTLTDAELCDIIHDNPEFSQFVQQVLNQGMLGVNALNTIVDSVCLFTTSSPATRASVWDAKLSHAVSLGLLTEDDRLALGPLLDDPTVIDTWIPNTLFGVLLLDNYDTNASESNSGVGLLVGAIIGGLIGAAAGPGGIEVGVMVGAAAGNLAETVYHLGDDSSGSSRSDEEGGDEGEEGGDGGGDGGDGGSTGS